MSAKIYQLQDFQNPKDIERMQRELHEAAVELLKLSCETVPFGGAGIDGMTFEKDPAWVFPPSFFDQLSDRLEIAVYDTNQEYRAMAITNGKDFASIIKARIAASKANAEQVKADVVASLDHFDSTVAVAAKVGNDVKAEADALMAEIGQFDNGGPPLDDHTTALPPVGPAVSYP